MVSSGQARVIALTARINDIEFQGQQINQQRTTLANKSSEFYNSMLDMNVPTPPSKTDFTKIVYKGIQSASKFKIENVLPTQDGKYNIRLGYEQQGLSMKKSTSGLMVSNTVAEFQANKLSDEDIAGMMSKDVKDKTVTIGGSYTEQEAFEEDANTDVLLKVSGSDYKKWATSSGKNVNPLGIYDANGKPVQDPSKLKDTDTIYVRCNMADLNDSGAYVDLATIGKPKDSDVDWATQVYKIAAEESNLLSSTYTEDSTVLALRLYTGTPGGTATKIVTAAQLQEAIDKGEPIYKRCGDGDIGTVSFGNPDYQEGQDNYSVNDIPLMRMDSTEAREKLGDSYNSFLTALKHSFPEFKDDEIAQKFYVYHDGETFRFIKKDSINTMKDQSSVTSYVYDESGTYTEHKDTKGCELKFDTNTGRITEIGIPADDGTIQYVEVTAEEATDDDAYETAYNEYEYDKYLYDKKQNDINAQLSIIQAEDRNLELKLTRLDNERNALNTELEACKKVVKEGTERGAKTFNG